MSKIDKRNQRLKDRAGSDSGFRLDNEKIKPVIVASGLGGMFSSVVEQHFIDRERREADKRRRREERREAERLAQIEREEAQVARAQMASNPNFGLF